MPPFTVLHVCMGNICRSPMAERLLLVAVAATVGNGPQKVGELVHSHSVGTGGWHVDEQMHRSAARQVSARGGEPDGFRARQLHSEHLDGADLILAATADQQRYVSSLRADAAPRTFVLGELARLLPRVDRSALPPAEPTPEGVQARGTALVAALDTARAGAPPQPDDDLDDPWGMGEQTFARVAGEIEDALRPLAAALLPPTS